MLTGTLNRGFACLLAGFLCCLLCAPAFADFSLPGYPANGHWPYGPSNTAETWSSVSESLLMYGEGTALRIADVSDPTNMVKLGEVTTDDLIWHIDILDNGQMAAVSGRGTYITLINISNRQAPTILGTYQPEVGRLAWGLAFGPVGSNRLYAAISPAGLSVLDISNPASPNQLGMYENLATNLVPDVEVLGNYAFLADDVEGVTAVNISNPALPVFSAVFAEATGAFAITLDGNRAYVARGTAGVHIIDLNVSGSPAVMTGQGVITTGDTPNGSSTFRRAEIDAEGRAIVSGISSGNGLHIYDVDPPANPAIIGTYFTPTLFAAVLGDTAFASAPQDYQASKIRAVDLDPAGNPSVPVQIDELLTFDKSYDVNIADNLVLVGNGEAGALVIDASNPANPTTKAIIPMGNTRSVAKVGNTLVVASINNNLQLIDVSDLNNPVLLNPYNLGGGNTAYQVEAIPNTNRVVIAANFGGVMIVDFTNPNSPSVYAHWVPTVGNVTTVSIDDDMVAAGGQTRIWAVDFSTPGTPVAKEAAAPLLGNLTDIDIQSDHVYVADGVHGVRIFDHANNAQLTEVGFYVPDQGTVEGIKVRSGIAYLAAGARFGLLQLDVSNPATPILLPAGQANTPGVANKVDTNGNLLVLTDLEGGVYVWGQTPIPSGPIYKDGFEPAD